MSNARVIEEIKVNPQALDIAKQQITATINKLNNVLEKAFSGGYEKPEGHYAVRVALYNAIWTSISIKTAYETLDNFETLNEYYDEIYRNIDKEIIQFCIDENAVKDDIAPKHIVDLLKALVLFHKALVRQEYYLSRFTENDSVSQVIDDVNTLRRQGDIIVQRAKMIDVKEIQREIAMRANMIQLFNEHIKQKGWGLKKISLDDPLIKDQLQLDDFTQEIAKFLAPLPMSAELDELICTIRQESNQNKISLLQKELQGFQASLNEAHDYLVGLLQRLDKYNEPAHIRIHRCGALAEDWQKHQDCFEVVKQAYQKIQPIAGAGDAKSQVRGYLEISEVGKALVNSCNNQAYSASYSFGITTNPWHTAAKTIQESIDELNKDFHDFLKPYLQIANQVQATKQEIDPYHELSNKLSGFSSQLAANIEKVLKLIKSALHDLSENILESNRQLESHTAFVGSFLLRHWGKILGGFLAGGGGSAVLILSLLNTDVLTSDEASPERLAIVGAFVTLFGTLTGFGAGAVKDMCCHSRADNLPANREERRPLLSHDFNDDQVVVDIPNDEEFDQIPERMIYFPMLSYVDVTTQVILPKGYHNNGIFSSVQNLLSFSDPNQPPGYGGPN